MVRRARSAALQHEAARRVQPGDGNNGALDPQAPKVMVFDPLQFGGLRERAREKLNDPILSAILNLYTDKQEYGRLAFDSAYKHPVVGAAFDGRMAILTSKRPKMKPQVRDPTPTQLEIAEFSNFLVDRFYSTKFIDGVIGQGQKYGFSLGEMTTRWEKWKGKPDPFLTIDRVRPMPQATLDNGFVPRYEYQYTSFLIDGRYRCFVLDEHGDIQSIRQFAYRGTLGNSSVAEPHAKWEGDDKDRIIHYVRMGGDGNPFGQSVMFTAMEAWSNLYALDKMEDVFLDTGLPILFGTYKTQTGRSRPDVHSEAKEGLDNMYVDAIHRFLMWQDGELYSVAPSNENFTTHIKQKKETEEARVWQAMGFPKSLVTETSASDTDSRNLVQVFFKHTLKRDLFEIGELVEDICARFVRANYGNLEAQDYAKAHWPLVTENEMRVAQNLLTALLHHLDSDKLPDFVHELFDFVPAEYVAKVHADSVAKKRPTKEDPAKVSEPPPKEDGEVRERQDGQTGGPSQEIDTGALSGIDVVA